MARLPFHLRYNRVVAVLEEIFEALELAIGIDGQLADEYGDDDD
jgi:hypothetical protein